jgi:hypothetical protein
MRTRWIPLLLLAASCASPPEAPAPPGDDPWLILDLPERVRSSVPLVEFRGRVAVNELSGADVVLVIDLTNTTLEASGVDADGDGIVGTNRPWADMHSRSDVRFQRSAQSWTSDFDDAIVNVQLAAARRLTSALAERNCRVGIVTFTGKPKVVAKLGAPPDALRALERIRVPVDRTGTQPRLAFRVAARLFDAAPPQRVPARRPVLIFFSDGAETNFRQQAIRRDAERAAETLAARGIAVHALGFGSDEAEDPSSMGRIAAFGRGLYLHVDRPDDALALVSPPLEIAELPVRNAAAPEDAPRALRRFADGSFDGFVPLVPGENRIDVEVVLGDGRRARETRTVVYEPSAEPQPDDAALLAALRDRTAETALAGESQSGSPRRRSQTIEIRGEPARHGDEAR